MIEANQVIRFY